MSQVLKDAVALLRTAVEKLDVRLQEIKTEETILLANRRALVTVIDGDQHREAFPVLREVAHEEVAPARPAVRAASPPASPPASADPLDAHILRVAGASGEPVPFRYIVSACRRYSLSQVKRSCAKLLKAGQLTREGKTRSATYSLPTGRAKRGPAALSAPGVPADDDGPGASGLDTSAGHSGVSPAPMEDNPPPPPDSRPPASISSRLRAVAKRLREPIEESPKSLVKVSIAHQPESDDDDDADAEDLAAGPDDFDDDLAAVDEQDDLDVEPCVAKPGRKPRYKPGTRQLHATSGTAKADGSWWMRPDADFAAEAERMRLSPRRTKTPGENNIIAMNAVW